MQNNQINSSSDILQNNKEFNIIELNNAPLWLKNLVQVYDKYLEIEKLGSSVALEITATINFIQS